MSNNPSAPEEPRFFFLMPVWGKRYIDYLLTFALPTLLSPNNLPWLPNRAVSQFTFITRSEDEEHIRASKLFKKLEALIPVKFIFLDFYQGDRIEKFDQLGNALRLGAGEALGRGYCLFFHPDGLYSDGMVKHLYSVARSGKKACVTHGPNATIEKIVPYLRERNLLTFDEVSPIAPRVLSRALMDNLHPDTTIHCMGNPHYPVDPYMGFWLSPRLDGAIFRFVSLHPWLVDLRHLSEILEFVAIDHNFVRVHGYIWSDVHIETDSDNILVIGLKPENERNAIPNRGITRSPVVRLTRSLYKYSNCNYSRFCFFHGLKVHTGELDADWHRFEAANLRWINAIIFGHTVSSSYAAKLLDVTAHVFRIAVIERRPLDALKYAFDVFRRVSRKILRARFFEYAGKFFRYAVLQRRPVDALKYAFNICRWLSGELFGMLSRIFSGELDASPPMDAEFCAVCRSDARRCVSGDMRSHV
jgi:hypothetical protein